MIGRSFGRVVRHQRLRRVFPAQTHTGFSRAFSFLPSALPSWNIDKRGRERFGIRPSESCTVYKGRWYHVEVLCVAFRRVRVSDRPVLQNGSERHRFQSGHGLAGELHPRSGVGDCLYVRGRARGARDRPPHAAVPVSFRRRHGTLMAVLFQGVAAWGRFQSRPHRQAQRAPHHTAFDSAARGKRKPQSHSRRRVDHGRFPRPLVVGERAVPWDATLIASRPSSDDTGRKKALKPFRFKGFSDFIGCLGISKWRRGWDSGLITLTH